MSDARKTTLLFFIMYLSPLTFDAYLLVNLFEKPVIMPLGVVLVYMRDNFCNFLFGFLHTHSLLEKGSALKGNNFVPFEANSFLLTLVLLFTNCTGSVGTAETYWSDHKFVYFYRSF